MRLWKKAGMLGMGALSLAGGLALPASPAGADDAAHFFTLGGGLYIKDDEVIERRSEYCNRGLAGRDFAQLPSDDTVELHDTNNGCGGEVRVEVHVTGVLNHGPGWCVDGIVQLYEGARESNNDLDGTQRFSQCGNSGTNMPISGRVRNTNEGGDWADYNIMMQLG
jgi:hypothetical protein